MSPLIENYFFYQKIFETLILNDHWPCLKSSPPAFTNGLDRKLSRQAITGYCWAPLRWTGKWTVCLHLVKNCTRAAIITVNLERNGARYWFNRGEIRRFEILTPNKYQKFFQYTAFCTSHSVNISYTECVYIPHNEVIYFT